MPTEHERSTKSSLNLSTCPLPELASAVNRSVSTVGDGYRLRFGARKVFVSAVLDALAQAGYTVEADVVKLRLVEAHRRGLLSLARADLVAAMPVDLVIASEIQCRWATFHFVVDADARDPWEVAGDGERPWSSTPYVHDDNLVNRRTKAVG